MPAYLISEFLAPDRSDAERYAGLAAASVALYGGRYLAQGVVPTVVEGAGPDGRRVSVVEFPSMTQLRSWHGSPEYALALAVRTSAMERRLLFVDGAPGAP